MLRPTLCRLLNAVLLLLTVPAFGAGADLILHGGKIVTVDNAFSIHRALAVAEGRIVKVGSDAVVLALKRPDTQVIDLAGRTVVPGLIDSHVHPAAALTEFDHPIPAFETIPQVLDYIAARARELKPGEWIYLRQVFITRLKEQRYPTRAELDRVAPNHPVNFSTGPDNMLNTLALKRSGIDRSFKVTDGGPGYMETDPETGELTGLLRGLGRFVKMKDPNRSPTTAEADARTAELFRDYSATGLTTIGDRGASASSLERYQRLRAAGQLPVRVMCSHTFPTIGPMETISNAIAQIAAHPLRKPDPMLRVIGTKIWLDGGMLTGSAYLREPWGVSAIYGITDPAYRGVLNVPRERLVPMVRQVAAAGLQFTAHSVGDGAVHLLLDVYEQVGRELPIRATRPCITHCNFMSEESVKQAAKLGAHIDLQPDWLYLDARTLQSQFGYERLRWFQPLKSLFAHGVVVGGGSDHMQKIGSLRSVNPYNPFLGMWIAITRQARWYEGALHPEEALTREQALRLYTINNARLLFLENEVGSLEPGKRADLVILDRDPLACPIDDLKDTQAVQTFLDGKRVHPR
jgi:predicted amidohydrolase YtcJ